MLPGGCSFLCVSHLCASGGQKILRSHLTSSHSSNAISVKGMIPSRHGKQSRNKQTFSYILSLCTTPELPPSLSVHAQTDIQATQPQLRSTRYSLGQTAHVRKLRTEHCRKEGKNHSGEGWPKGSHDHPESTILRRKNKKVKKK